MDQQWPDLVGAAKTCQKWSKVVKKAIFGHFDPFWAILGDLGHYGQAMAITHEYEDQI